MSNIILKQGDCLELMKELPDESIDLILTDPPYAQKYNYLWEGLAKESPRILKKGGSLVTLCGHYQVPFVIETMSKYLKYWWIGGIAQRRSNRLAGKWVFVKWKPVLWYVKEHRRVIGYKCPYDLVSPIKEDWKDKKLHEWNQPEIFSENWIKYLINEGDIVLDPFMGSGTTGVACVQLNRNFIGYEISLDYVKIAEKRIGEAQAQKKLGD